MPFSAGINQNIGGDGWVVGGANHTLTPDEAARKLMFGARLDGLNETTVGYKAAFLRLEAALLSVGGWAAVPPLEVDGLVEVLYTNGQLFSLDGLTCVPMQDSACHSNTTEWYHNQTERDTGMCTGYALSPDGLWRQHSWGVLRGRIVETTIERIAYYGLTGKPERGA